MKTLMLIMALLACTLSGCGNTRIGGPWVYWEHGFWPVLGFLAVCGLIFLGLGLICGFTGDPSDNPDPGMLKGAIFFLVLAGLLLQALPHATNGLQFIPLPPWHYTGWIAMIISSVCWLCLGFACLLIISSVKDDGMPAAVSMFVALGLNVLLSFAGPSEAPVVGEQPSLKECRAKIAGWEKLRSERREAADKLSSDRDMLVNRIRSLGVSTKRELMGHPVGHTLAEELEHLSGQIEKLRSETDALDAVMERAKSSLRSLERETMLREVSADELSQIDHELKEKLDTAPGTEVRLDKLLDEAFQKENGR